MADLSKTTPPDAPPTETNNTSWLNRMWQAAKAHHTRMGQAEARIQTLETDLATLTARFNAVYGEGE